MDSMNWVSADYYFPSTYSIRVPGSSMANTKAMPAPGPATVRLAMIRTGIELFGFKKTKDELFPHICSAEIRVCPPEMVSISPQLVRVYKAAREINGKTWYQEGIAIREHAHAKGKMTVFVKTSITYLELLKTILANIGYWGQGDSMTYCLHTGNQEPVIQSCGLPVEQAENTSRNSFSCFVSEFANKSPKWQDVTHISDRERTRLLRFFLYLWPLEICEQHNGHILLRRLQGS
jgi:hypothetical protein